jgi:hypothetical protein
MSIPALLQELSIPLAYASGALRGGRGMGFVRQLAFLKKMFIGASDWRELQRVPRFHGWCGFVAGSDQQDSRSSAGMKLISISSPVWFVKSSGKSRLAARTNQPGCPLRTVRRLSARPDAGRDSHRRPLAGNLALQGGEDINPKQWKDIAMKGWRTLAFNLLIAVGGVIVTFDWGSVLPAEYVGLAAIVVDSSVLAYEPSPRRR